MICRRVVGDGAWTPSISAVADGPVMNTAYRAVKSPRGVVVAPAVRHRLPAARLIERVDDLDPEPLQELECGDADLRKQRVDIAGDEQADFHAPHSVPKDSTHSTLNFLESSTAGSRPERN